MEFALLVQNLEKRYGPRQAVRGVSFAVRAGEIFGLLGRNGAGKTTTLECIIGLRRPNGGSVQVGGMDALAEPGRAREKIGVQLQATALQDKITPRQALRLFASFYPNPTSIEKLLTQFDLTDKADAAFDTLSGGQRQRLAIALALLHQPEIVFLDEPTAGLDPQARRDLHGVIAQLRAAGRTIVLTTHYMDEAEKLCDRVAVIDNGQILALGTPAELIANARILPRILIRTARTLVAAQVEALAAVTRTDFTEGRWTLTTSSVTQTLLALVHLVESEGNELLDLRIFQPTLEDTVTVPQMPNPAEPLKNEVVDAEADGPGGSFTREPGARAQTSAPWRGLFAHFKLTLLLNFRSRQALVYGYLVPIFFLVAFGSIFRFSRPPLLGQLGQLLTITVLGGACFGMPTALVAERERGVWRRYRLLPAAMGGASLVISTMLARFVIVLSAAILQIALAKLMYGMPWPALPLAALLAFCVVTFAFIGMGLVIAMLADTVPAVQALGQAIFLPMIMIGGVGVPLWTLPAWAQHAAGFLPGKYAVRALDACAATTAGLPAAGFDLAALVAIGVAACFAGAKMFRWDAHEKIDPRARRWAIVALVAWLAVGITAECTGRAAPQTSNAPDDDAAWRALSAADINAITFDNMESDDSTVTPVARDLSALDADAQKRADEIRAQLRAWPPGRQGTPLRRVRNLLAAASIVDIAQAPYEGLFARLVFDQLQKDFPAPSDDLARMLTWIILHPRDPQVPTTVPELGVPVEESQQDVEDRVPMYARKLLQRVIGKN